ncbi:hypothetical protein EBB07_29480 [Paenibacillaceae bacterium]|nr:hypothetical protein EBB07_29480 [Paenibacillaceae bacterium]
MSRKNKRKDNRTAQNQIVNDVNNTDEDFNYFLNYSKALSRAVRNSHFFDPYLQNQNLKSINMNPTKYSREEIDKLVANPERNEKELRELSEYIQNSIMQFKRIVYFYGTILTFDFYPEPTNADEEDMRSPAFKKSYKKMNDWLDKFNPRKQFSDIMRVIMRTDVSFHYLRESKNHISLQEMPYDYCKIVAKTDLGYQYAFNMAYFFQDQKSLDGFDPIFKTYFESYQQTSEHKNGNSYWIILDPLKAPVFKFDENVAGIVSPLLGLLGDSIDIETYKGIYKTKSKLDILKIILNKIPMHNDSKGVQAKNNFSIDAGTAAEASARMQFKIEEAKVLTSPFETKIHEFEQKNNNEAQRSAGNDTFFDSAGINPTIFGKETSTSPGIKASIRTSEAFVRHMYFVFERYINALLRQVTGRYRWKIHFEGTEFDREERFERALKGAQYGLPISYAVVARGSTVDEFVNLTNFENAFELKSKLIPLVSSHTLNGNETGKPVSSNVSESGEKTRDYESNE